jgi:hypothetical protein
MGPRAKKNRVINYNLMKQYLSITSLLIIISITCHSQEIKTPFTFKTSNQGVELFENWKPVFFYQKIPKSYDGKPDGKYKYNNYLHPIYSLKGDTLTEEFPVDHPHHRGIFWAWHQLYIDGKSIGDGWIMEDIIQEVTNVSTFTNKNYGQLQLDVLWKSSLFENCHPFISEHTTITVYRLQDSVRKIDFVISLKALVPDVEIGGSNDEKGYGGLCARLKLSENLTFTSTNGKVNPQLGQITSGSWMDFSAPFERNGGTNGLSILCHPETPNYPAPWILRSEPSMQNIVFPGRNRIKLQTGKPVVLYYRIIIHNNNADKININKFQMEYEGTNVSK